MMQRWTCYAMILVTMLSMAMAVAAEEVPAPVTHNEVQLGTNEALEVAQVRFRPVRTRPARVRSTRSRPVRFRPTRSRQVRYRNDRFSTIRFRAPRRTPARFRQVNFRQVRFRSPRISQGGGGVHGAAQSPPGRPSAPVNTTASKARSNFAKALRQVK